MIAQSVHQKITTINVRGVDVLKAKQLKKHVSHKKTNKPIVMKSSDIKHWPWKKRGGCCGK